MPSYSSPWAFCAVWRCGSDAALTVGPFSVNRPTSTPETSQTKNTFMTNICDDALNNLWTILIFTPEHLMQYLSVDGERCALFASSVIYMFM